MSNSIEINLSNNHTVTIFADGTASTCDPDAIWTGEGRWDGDRLVDGGSLGGDDPFDAELDAELEAAWHARKSELSGEGIIDAVVGHYGCARGDVAYGFLEWCYDVIQKTRTQLADGEFSQLSDDLAELVDSAHRIGQAVRTVTEQETVAWLADNRADLIAALDEEIAEM